MQNILVTGSSGFIASHLVEYLSKIPNVHIIAMDKLDYVSNNTHEKLPSNCIFVHGDICDGTLMLATINKYKIDTIAHLAAQTSVDRSFSNVQIFVRDNIQGTQVVLDAIRLSGRTIRLMHMSTDEVYGSVTHCIDETAAMNPTNPYAATKASAEMLIRGHQKSHGLDVVIARCNNVYGAHQHREKLIPRFIELLKSGKKCTIHGTGSVKRRFLHVRDACDALYTLIIKGKSGEAYNIGALNVVSIINISKTIITRVTGCSDWETHVEYVADRLFNDLDYNCASDKICELGWSPKITLEEGIRELC